MKVKRYMEVEVCICDFCKQETIGNEWYRCMMCGRHICMDCNKGRDFAYRGLCLNLCPECYDKVTLKEAAEKARKVYEIEDC